MNKSDLLKVMLAFTLFASFFIFFIFQNPITGLVFSVLVLIAGSWWCTSSFRELKFAASSSQWPTIPFEVISSRIAEIPPGIAFTGPPRYAACFRLAYSWGGISYECDENQLRSVPSPIRQSPELAQKLIDTLEQKAEIIVSPEDPKVVFYEPDNPRSFVLQLVLSGMVSAVAFGFSIAFLLHF